MSPDPETRAKQILERLVAFESVSDRSNLSVVAYIEDYLRSLGVASRRAPNIRGDKAALWATIGPDADGGVVLSGHMDVVPVAGQVWTGDPFSLREIDGRLYARGACDMKGFVASALAMVPAFQAAAPKRPVHLLFSYDEETTCLGSLDFITAFGTSLPRPGLVIVGEPTMMEVADAHKGVATFQTRVTGVEAHSARPSLGANAISAACEIVAEIDRLGRECEAPEWLDLRFDPPYSTYHVGMIHGGNARNILARECVFHWEFRGLPNFSARSALERVQRFVDDTALPRLRRFAGSASVETVMEVDVPGLRAEAESAAATLALRLGRSNQTIAVSYATEAGHFQLAGLPTIVCGPGSIDQAHKPDEYLDTAQLRACLAFLRELSEANAK